jgi:GntR family transcriptional regulator/MocR family aminotransferase
MPDTWATSGIDLHLELTGRRVRTGLEAALRDAVRTGRLRPATQLPSSRALASDLGIARNTVAEAYGQLVAEGWLTARRGSGTQVADRAAEAGAAPVPPAAQPDRLRYNLRPGSPDLAAFPRQEWLAAARQSLAAAPSDALGYGDPRGRPELRRALAGYLSRARGVRADPERIIICSGFTHGLGLLCQALRARGAAVLATEAYGLQVHRDVAAVRGLRLAPLPVDAEGAAVSELGGADAVLLTPAHQFPLGVALAARRRTMVVEWARRTGGLVIEDDYDGEFRYDRQPIGAVQALAPEHVVYAGTASKSLAPGLSLGWLILPAALIDEVAAVLTLAGGHPAAFDQLTLAEFIEAGRYDRQLRRSRLAYRRRRDRLVAALRRHAPDVRITGIAAGLHALLTLSPGQREEEVVSRAARHSLALEGLRPYRAQRRHGRGPSLVVGYGTPPEHAFTGAVARLCAVLSEPAGS